MDDDTRAFLREQVCSEFSLPSIWADRLSGNSVAALRDDAKALARTLGIAVDEPEPAHTHQRDEGGRFTSADMNRLIRGALYDGNIDVRAAPETEPLDGTLGAGRGHLNEPKPPKQDMSALIRAATGRA